MKYSETLKRIHANINAGGRYGYNVSNVQYPYFSDVLFVSINNFIVWRHYGQSANRNSLKELLWIITEIFRTTPEQFENDYELRF